MCFRILQAEHSSILDSIKYDLRQAQLKEEHCKIVSWLSRSLPEVWVDHNSARDTHEKTTGTWLLKGEEFKGWTAYKSSFLWLNSGGMFITQISYPIKLIVILAGADKTILCSTVIEHLKAHYSDPVFPVIYWYLSYANATTQNISNFLCFIVKDLCSDAIIIPDIVLQIYSESNNGQQRPTTIKLYTMLKALLEIFADVYLVVDALEEFLFLKRDDLLKILEKIHELKSDKLHLFLTSRPEADIPKSFDSLFKSSQGFWSINAQNHHMQLGTRNILIVNSNQIRDSRNEKMMRGSESNSG